MAKNSKKKRKARLVGIVHCPRTFFLITHNAQTDKVMLMHQDMLKSESAFHSESHIVSAVNISELAVYFGFLDTEDRLEAYTALISFIAKTGRLSLSEYSGGLLPTALKQAFLKAISKYKQFVGGQIATKLFIRKLGRLMMTVWRHGQQYLSFFKRQRIDITDPLFPTLSTEFSC